MVWHRGTEAETGSKVGGKIGGKREEALDWQERVWEGRAGDGGTREGDVKRSNRDDDATF